jgi:site-specific DNA recombinase
VTSSSKTADLYLRLSDFRGDPDSFDARERKLRTLARTLGWAVGRVVVENDLTAAAEGRSRPASAFKRRKVVTPSGREEWRVYRPGFRSVLDDLMTGRAGALLAEDLDRACRDPRDLEDLIDAAEARGASARSLSGSLTLTDGGTDSEITMARMMVAVANKDSRDKRRRVSEQRERTAEAGFYGGGRRPFGYRPDPDAPKYGKTLLIVPAEAGHLREASRAILARAYDPADEAGASLRAYARLLRELGVATVTGAPWTAETLRDALMKPTIAGLAAHTRAGRDENGDPVTITTLYPASWEPILLPEEWEALCAVLTDPGRTTSPGNAPRWLGTNQYLCGICETPTLTASGGSMHGSPSYMCVTGKHLRRSAIQVDEYVGRIVAARLALPDVADLLLPPARPGVDAGALRDEAARLRRIGEAQAQMHAVGDMTDAEFAAGSRARKARLDRISGELAATVVPDRLAEFRAAGIDTSAVWAGLPLDRQRSVLGALATVTILKAEVRGRGFRPEFVQVNWHAT